MVDSSVVWRDSNSLISDIGIFWIIRFPETCGSLEILIKDLICFFPLFEFPRVFFEHLQVCIDLPLQILFPTVFFFHHFVLLRWYRADSSTEQFCAASQYCNILHWSGRCFDHFSFSVFRDSTDLSFARLDIQNSWSPLTFWKHKDPKCHNWLKISLIRLAFFFSLQVPRMPSVRLRILCCTLWFPSMWECIIYISFLVRNNVVEHGYEDDSITEVFTCDAFSFQIFLNFWGKIWCSGSCEIFWVELNRFSFKLTLVLSTFWLWLHQYCVCSQA